MSASAAQAAATPTTAPKSLLEQLGVSSSKQLAAESFAKVLLLGPPKSGKTVALCSAPKPLLINCDGGGAAAGAVEFTGQDFLTIDVYNRKGWELAQKAAAKLVQEGEVSSIIVDTLTLLGDRLVDQLRTEGFGKFELWAEFDSAFRCGIKRILDLPAHVFLTAHIYHSHDDDAGVLPNVPGQAKEKIPGMVNQWILLDYEEKRNPKRQFILAPQDKWVGGCRGMRKSDVCAATVPAMFDALGIAA